jgi:pentatricopeptide repeat protein
MHSEPKAALGIIRSCVRAGRYRLLKHFRDRMTRRGLVWADVLAVLDKPAEVRSGGPEKHHRPKWVLTGSAADGLEIEFVCVFEDDEHGNWVLFITLY